MTPALIALPSVRQHRPFPNLGAGFLRLRLKTRINLRLRRLSGKVTKGSQASNLLHRTRVGVERLPLPVKRAFPLFPRSVP